VTDIIYEVINIENFKIAFEVPYDGRLKELTMPISSTWFDAQLIISEKMICKPERLVLGYINPFKKANGKKPMSLETEEEWNGLIQHVREHLNAQNVKNNGKGAVQKPWCITLVDLREHASSKVRICSHIEIFNTDTLRQL